MGSNPEKVVPMQELRFVIKIIPKYCSGGNKHGPAGTSKGDRAPRFSGLWANILLLLPYPLCEGP